MTIMKKYWSKSRLKCFRECPYRYKLRYIDGVKGKTAEITNKGIILHELFDVFYKNYDKTKTLIQNIEDAQIKIKRDVDFWEEYAMHVDAFISMNKNKIELYSQDKFMPIYTEMKIEAKGWKGIIDRIDMIDDKVILLDYKTSTGYDMSKYIDELLLYAWLFQEEKSINVTHVGIFFTKNNNLVIEEISQKDILDNIEEMNFERDSYIESIKRKEFNKNPGYYCKTYCGYYGIACDGKKSKQ